MARVRWSFGALLCAALVVALPVRAISPELARVSLELGQLEALLGRAHFREAGEKALLLRSRALALPPSGDARRLVVRAELVAGKAAVALGQSAIARDCFVRALRLEPWLALDPGTPTKVLRSFEAAKAIAR
jgi:hypothetical protein